MAQEFAWRATEERRRREMEVDRARRELQNTLERRPREQQQQQQHHLDDSWSEYPSPTAHVRSVAQAAEE
jgi:hypothetical protein